MSSSDQRASDVLAEVELVLREHDVDPALAARIRALLSVVARDDSQSWERGSVPGTRVSLDSVSTIGPVRIDATQPARPGAREPERAREAITDRITAPMPASPLLLPLQLLATGGMGEVHRAHDRPLARDLAMKVLHAHLAPLPRMRARFLDEAQITAQLAHPSIPPVHALGELEDGRPYFTMKEVRGRTLAEIIDRGFGPDGA